MFDFETVIPTITKIAEQVGFVLEDDTTGESLRFGRWDLTWFGADEASPENEAKCQTVKSLLTEEFGSNVIVKVDAIDQWASVLVKRAHTGDDYCVGMGVRVVQDSTDLGLDKGAIGRVKRVNRVKGTMDCEFPHSDEMIAGIAFSHPDLEPRGGSSNDHS